MKIKNHNILNKFTLQKLISVNRIEIICIFLILFFLFISDLKSQQVQDTEIQELIYQLDSLNITDFRLGIVAIYLRLDEVVNSESKYQLYKKLFDITQKRDEESHIMSLAYPEIYPDSIRGKNLAKALNLAKDLNNPEQIMWVQERRSRFFIETNHFDSAMIVILKMRDIYEINKNDPGVLNLNHMLGDIYYHANLYDQAKETYLKVLDYYEKNKEFNFWQPYVIMNNIGQIGMHTQNYDTAMHWFQRSLLLAEQFLTTPEHINIKAYILLKITETFLLNGNFDKAKEMFHEVELMPYHLIRDDVRKELTVIKSKILYKEGNYHQSLQELAKITHSNYLSESIKSPELLLMFSNLYKKQGKTDTSLDYLEKYENITDSLHKQGNINRSLIILAEKNHEKTQNELELSKKQNLFILIILGFVLLATIIISVLFRRLYLSKIKLINKSIGTIQNPPLEINPEEKEELKKLFDRLESIMSLEKVYLDPHLTIQKTAEYLSSNRSYLSKAINTMNNTNFPTYINEWRIKEIIRLISEGMAKKLTQEALAEKSGFANRTVFINAFKKYTGVTPSFFIKNYHE